MFRNTYFGGPYALDFSLTLYRDEHKINVSFQGIKTNLSHRLDMAIFKLTMFVLSESKFTSGWH